MTLVGALRDYPPTDVPGFREFAREAQNPGGSLFSVERLTALLGALPATGTRTIVDAVFDDVRHFAGEAEPADDITLLAIRRCPV